MPDKPRILCIDDEANILTAIQRSLRRSFDVHTAASGPEGLQILHNSAPFAVVVSDMRMPVMNGAVFLRNVARNHPDTVRILLTGFAELETVTAAVNEGHIYRFLTKPISGKDLATALEDGVRQHQLICSERVLLEQTLTGCIHAMDRDPVHGQPGRPSVAAPASPIWPRSWRRNWKSPIPGRWRWRPCSRKSAASPCPRTPRPAGTGAPSCPTWNAAWWPSCPR